MSMVHGQRTSREVTAAISLLLLASETHVPRLDLSQKRGEDRVLAASNYSDQGKFL